MKLVCPECKNDVDLMRYTSLDVGHVIECQMCGITLLVKRISPERVVEAEIMDEGK